MSNNVLLEGILCEGTFFSLILSLSNFLICTYLRHCNYFILFFASTFDILYLFNFLVLVFQVVRNDEGAIEHDKIMR
jgi:hypothetical protein